MKIKLLQNNKDRNGLLPSFKKNKNVSATIYHQNVTKQFVIISLYVNILFIDKIGATFSSQHLILVHISDYFHLFAY